MEMNTRLQVEHPVTEMIVGQDLVEWQIRVANGEPLPLTQSQVPLKGHAFEARIYAENVSKGFLPAAGVLHHYHPVPVSETVRVETGVVQGDNVSVHYDPMIAKLVVWGEDRKAALVKLKDCLSKFHIGGLPTNISFLQRLANHQAFENGLVETHFIEHFKDDLLVNSSGALSVESHTAAKLGATVAAACICRLEQIISSENIYGRDNLLSLWYAHPPFRMHHSAQRVVELEWDKESDGNDTELFKIFITYQTDGSYLVQTGSEDPGVQVKVTHIGKCDFRVDVNGLSADVSLAIYSKEDCKHIHIWHAELQHHFWQKKQPEQSGDDVSEHKPSFETASHPKGSVVAPMAGLVVKVLVENGTTVEAGEPILVLEAMKMEHVVKAPRSGCISGLQVAPGQQIFDADVLFSVKDA